MTLVNTDARRCSIVIVIVSLMPGDRQKSLISWH
jgi:hypothetical protein